MCQISHTSLLRLGHETRKITLRTYTTNRRSSQRFFHVMNEGEPETAGHHSSLSLYPQFGRKRMGVFMNSEQTAEDGCYNSEVESQSVTLK